MFFRIVTTKTNGKRYSYLKLLENYRENGRTRQRVIANLGNIEGLYPNKIEGLITSLVRIYEGFHREDAKPSLSPLDK